MKYSPRVIKHFQKFAHLIGSGLKDAEGKVWDFGPDRTPQVQKQHLFYVKNNVDDNARGAFHLGNVILGLIIDDMYDIEYLGLHKHSYPAEPGEEMSKEHKKTFDRVTALKKRIDADIQAQRQRTEEDLGVFRPPVAAT